MPEPTTIRSHPGDAPPQILTDRECEDAGNHPAVRRAHALAALQLELLLGLHNLGLYAVVVHVYPAADAPALSFIAHRRGGVNMAEAEDVGRLARRLDAEVTIGALIENGRQLWQLHTRDGLVIAVHARPADPRSRNWSCQGCGWFAAGTDLAAALAAAHNDQTGHIVATQENPE